jgi:hypothetical protein
VHAGNFFDGFRSAGGAKLKLAAVARRRAADAPTTLQAPPARASLPPQCQKARVDDDTSVSPHITPD